MPSAPLTVNNQAFSGNRPWAIQDASDMLDIITDPDFVDIGLMEDPLLAGMTFTTDQFQGKQRLITVEPRVAYSNARIGQINDNLPTANNDETLQLSMLQSDLRQLSSAYSYNWITKQILDGSGAAARIDVENRTVEVGMSAERWRMKILMLLDQHQTRADVGAGGIFNLDGTAYTTGCPICAIPINRSGTAVGTLARFRPGELVAIHVAATGPVRVYARVLECRFARMVGASTSAAGTLGPQDWLILSVFMEDYNGLNAAADTNGLATASTSQQTVNTSWVGTLVQQTTYTAVSIYGVANSVLGRLPDATLASTGASPCITFTGVVAGDYIRSFDGWNNGVAGLDFYASASINANAGVSTSFPASGMKGYVANMVYGLDMAAGGNDWYRNLIYDCGGQMLRPNILYSFFDQSRQTWANKDLERTLLMHTSQFRQLSLLADAGGAGGLPCAVRPIGATGKKVGQIGWTQFEFVYGDRTYRLVTDEMQVPSRISILDQSTFECCRFTGSDAQWVPGADGNSRWSQRIAPTTNARLPIYDASRMGWRGAINVYPQKTQHLVNVAVPDYNAV